MISKIPAENSLKDQEMFLFFKVQAPSGAHSTSYSTRASKSKVAESETETSIQHQG